MSVKSDDKKNKDLKIKSESIIDNLQGVFTGFNEEYKIESKDKSECSKSCPAGVNVKAYINYISNRKFEDAIELIREANPFPAVCGRVCTRPCEDTCELGNMGDSISIRALKRYASDYELARRSIKTEQCEIKYDEKIAIIGAGPAGLSAAVDLVRMGYPVTVFEAQNKPGGMLCYGIPAYRLPDRILKREIDWIKSIGIKIKTGVKITNPKTLLKKGFSAVLIAGGAPKSFPLGIEGEKSYGVIDALKFLKDVNECNQNKIEGNVVVIGGGSTAFDAARSAIRLGAKKVTLAYRRGIEEMPAEKEEIQAAKDEGVKILTLVIPKRIITKGKKSVGVEFLKAKLGDKDSSGRRRPLAIKNSEFIIDSDFVIPAIGAMPDIDHLDGVKVTTPKGVINVKENSQTLVEGIFAAGDVEMGPSSVVEAIGRGHDAAIGIDAYIRKKPHIKTDEIVKTLQIYLGSPINSYTKYSPKRLIKGKVDNFKEVEGSFSDFEAVEEASRCFSCGPCYACPVCLPNCKNKQLVAEIENTTVLVKGPLELSRNILQKGPSEFKLKVEGADIKKIKLYSLTSKIDSSLCIGCGRCEEVCAYRAIKNIISKDQRTVSQVAYDSCASCSACVSECPSGAISQGYMSDNEILDRLSNKKTKYDGIKGLMSYWSKPTPIFGSYNGIVELMSARKPSPMFLIRALARSGRGLLVIRPNKATGSHYLPWEESPDEVVEKTWDLLRLVGLSTDRIQYVYLPKEKDPMELLEVFSKKLDEKGLKKLKIPIPEHIQSPFGEAILILRILSANPDTKPSKDFKLLNKVKTNYTAYFDGCLPLITQMGKAHNLFDISQTRSSTIQLLNTIKTDIGYLDGVLCPSKILLDLDKEKYQNIVKKIYDENKTIINKIKPEKIIIATPESYLTFSKEKIYEKIVPLPDLLLKELGKTNIFNPIEKTVVLHQACNLEKDYYFNTTKKLLKLIPGIRIFEINEKCGQKNFNHLDGNSKQDAINFMKKSVELGADTIICTSPYCEAHLLMCSREGSWKAVEIEISNVYQLLLNSITGEN